MTTKIMGIIVLCLALGPKVFSQDLTCAGIAISRPLPFFGKTAKFTIKNEGKCIAEPMNLYVELHTNNEADNPIAQIRIRNPHLLPYASITKRIRLSSFKPTRGFQLSDATKIVVICDPKNEVVETNETNNISEKEIH